MSQALGIDRWMNRVPALRLDSSWSNLFIFFKFSIFVWAGSLGHWQHRLLHDPFLELKMESIAIGDFLLPVEWLDLAWPDLNSFDHLLCARDDPVDPVLSAQWTFKFPWKETTVAHSWPLQSKNIFLKWWLHSPYKSGPTLHSPPRWHI